MAGVGCRGLWLRVIVSFLLVLSAWVSSLMCLSLHGLGKTLQHTGVAEATVAGGRRGKILFDGKDLELQVGPSAAASGKLLKIIRGQSTLPEKLEKEDSKHLKPSLHCGRSQMEFRATGHRAAEIQLDTGAAHPLPLNQVPKSCGYTVRKSALGFVMAVSYNGCNVIRENGNYVLKMRWLNASVELICSMTTSSKLPNPVASQLFQEPRLLPVRTWRPTRHRRDATGQLYYDPYFCYYACLYYCYMHMMNLVHASDTQTGTVAAPQMPPGDGQQIPLPFPYYNPYYYQVGNTPVMAPPSSACDSTGTQCSQDPPGKMTLPSYPSSGPTQQGFPGSPLPQQVLQQYDGKYPYQPLPQTPLDVPGKPQDDTKQEPPPTSSTAPATVTSTPCPSTERPIAVSRLGPAIQYVPYENLTFRPYVSYEGKPAKGQQTIPQTRLDFTKGAHPRAFSGFGNDKPALTSPVFPESSVVGNPWFPYYIPYVK